MFIYQTEQLLIKKQVVSLVQIKDTCMIRALKISTFLSTNPGHSHAGNCGKTSVASVAPHLVQKCLQASGKVASLWPIWSNEKMRNMTYFEIAKRKKHFHNTGISLHFIYATIRPPKPTPTPQPSEVQPGHCMNAHQNADGAHQNLGMVSWSVNGIVWSVGKTIFDNSSVLVIWFSLGPFSRVLSDFLHVFSPKSTNCISFRRIQSVQSTCPPWWGNSRISPGKRVWKFSDLNLADPENWNPWIFDTIPDVMFAVHTKCQLHRSHQKRCVDLKTPNACLESLALVSAHVELLSLSSTMILSIPQLLVRDMTFVLAIKFCWNLPWTMPFLPCSPRCRERPVERKEWLAIQGHGKAVLSYTPNAEETRGKWDRNVVGACWDFFNWV